MRDAGQIFGKRFTLGNFACGNDSNFRPTQYQPERQSSEARLMATKIAGGVGREASAGIYVVLRKEMESGNMGRGDGRMRCS